MDFKPDEWLLSPVDLIYKGYISTVKEFTVNLVHTFLKFTFSRIPRSNI